MNYELQTKHGLTLMEMTVVIVVVALLASFALPAARMLFNSFQSQSGTKAVISAALSSARAIAAEHQHYAGVRFQNRYQEDNKGCQYMIFIVQDPEILAWGFRAVEGYEPIKLPDLVGVMDLRIRTNLSNANDPNDEPIDYDNKIDEPNELRDTTAFSIIFSPSGKMVIHDVRVRNRDGTTTSKDDIFNTKFNVENEKIAMFYQDDYADMGLGQEYSRSNFIIYDRNIFEKVDPDRRYTDYLEDLASQRIYINPYTGTMIKR
jgi:prepilin-type N-terminal cleavage/methylation domain-containing protein